MQRPGTDPGKRIRFVRLTALFVAIACAWLFVAKFADAATHPNHTMLARAHVAFDVGDYPGAVAYLETLLAASVPGGDTSTGLEIFMLLADSYRSLGMNRNALDYLRQAALIVDSSVDAGRLAVLYNRLGAAYRAVGQYETALEYLDRGITTVESLGRPDLTAALLNDLGNLHVSIRQPSAAVAAFDDSLRFAHAANKPTLITTAAINLTRALIEQGVANGTGGRLADSLDAATGMVPGTEQTEKLLAIATLYQKAQREFNGPIRWRETAHELFVESLKLAELTGDDRLAAYALGYRGHLYEEDGRNDEAMLLTRRAVFLSQNLGDYASLYRWEWQVARLHVAMSDTDSGIAAYRRALDTLREVRDDVVTSSHLDFRQSIGAIYFEMADLLLIRSRSIEGEQSVRRNLLEARDTLEQLKVAEIVEYFDNDCVVLDSDPAELEQLSSGTAIIYPVLLADRTELLVSFGDEIVQYTIPVGLDRMTEEIRSLRVRIERYDGRHQYLDHAQTLYSWLIAPIEARLKSENVGTLVFVPDGPLRTVPMAALHDGQQFLIEKYALATTPGLTLTSPKPLDRSNIAVLANGLSVSVQGFSPLPSVNEELRSIESLYAAQVYENETFQAAQVGKEMSEGDYSIVHIATHGQFDSDHRKSFLLTFDDRLTMNQLETTIGRRRYEDQPVELLVLSACETAAGDDRAALGLAGIALKAGARSAVASLWFINDVSTADLIADFYRHLKNPDNSKADALQMAQLSLISSEEYRHPAYWAPFLLIGNWL